MMHSERSSSSNFSNLKGIAEVTFYKKNLGEGERIEREREGKGTGQVGLSPFFNYEKIEQELKH